MQYLHDLFPVHRLIQIFHNAQIDGFLGIVKLIIGRHNDKYRMTVCLPDFLHGINSVDPRHLNVHKSDIRPKPLRQFDDASAGLSIFNGATIRKLLFNDKFQGINYDSLIIRQHDFIHFLPLPVREYRSILPFPYFLLH